MPEARSGNRTDRTRPVWLQRKRLLAGALALTASVLVAVIVTRGGDGLRQGRPGAAGFVGGDFHSLVVDPTSPGRLFVGGHQAVSGSTDGGRSWARVDSLDDADAMGWSFVGDTMYVSGHPGINRSTDGAATFAPANEGLPNTDVHAFGAATSTLYAAGPVIGVIASTDGGRTWRPRSETAGQSFFGRILTGPDDDAHLVAADARAGVLESIDGGRSWRRLGGPTSALWVSRSGASLYVSGPLGAARTVDDGKTWVDLALPEGATLVEADPSDPRILYAGVHDGSTVRVLVSRDGGERWATP